MGPPDTRRAIRKRLRARYASGWICPSTGLAMVGESYSAWFLRFLAAFSGREDRSAVDEVSREEWLRVFTASFRGERDEVSDTHTGSRSKQRPM
jgi:hypothetical protein